MGFRNPDKFCAVVSCGAAMSISLERSHRNYRDADHSAEHSPWALATNKTDALRRNLRVRMVCGEQAEHFASNVKFKDLLGQWSIPVEWVPVPGVAHDTRRLYRRVGIDSLKFIEAAFGSSPAAENNEAARKNR